MEETGSWWRDPLGWALALWGAAVAALGFPPGAVWPLALVAPAPLWALCPGSSLGQGFARGWLFGLGFFGCLLWWIVPTVVRYGGLPYPAGVGCLGALAAYLALFPASGAAAVAAASRKSASAALVLAPVAWTGLEGLRGVVLSGFPWGDLPQALWQSGPALDLAPWVGIDGVRLLTAGLASGVAWLLMRLGRGYRVSPWGLLPAGAAGSLAALLLALPSPLPPSVGQLGAAVVQGNIDQSQKWDPAYRKATLDAYLDLTHKVAAGPAGESPDLVLWPETAVPLYAQEPGPERERLESLAADLGIYLAFGAPAYERKTDGIEYRNAVFLIAPTGRLEGRYDKVHLVPFGEFVPMGRYLPFLKKLAHGVGDFTPGPGVIPLDPDSTLPVLGPLVCFEVIFSSLSAEHARRNAQLLIVVTNDGWFGRTPGPHQHLAFAAWRAAETGLPLIRAANTGVSAAFDARGRLLRTTPLGVRDAFAVQLPYGEPNRLPQLRVRPWISPACLVLAGLVLSAILRGSHRAT